MGKQVPEGMRIPIGTGKFFHLILFIYYKHKPHHYVAKFTFVIMDLLLFCHVKY